MTDHWQPEPELLTSLDAAVPGILASQKDNGQFGSEPWISTDQNVLFPLAAAWSLEDSTYYHDAGVLDAIIRGGDAMIEDQDQEGKFLFKKKDHSTWGWIFQPWCYSRWVRAYWLVGEAMPPDARERWERGLQLGYKGIAGQAMDRVHNIPCHHAMGLYCAGMVFDLQDWRKQAADFMHRVCEAQSPNGWWPEHNGPVVSYNFVYSEALGAYYAMSGDQAVLETIERAARYHANLTYPDGSSVETVDGRNPYHSGVRLRGTGLCHCAAGRGYLARQHALYRRTGEFFPADYAAHLLIHGAEGPAQETAADADRRVWRMGEEAVTIRQRPWFVCLSAFTAEVPRNRWGQDRQNFVSVFHDQVGLIVGGGNAKLQPLWSNFTVGDPSLLRHTPGDEDPDFSPRDGLLHVPDDAAYEAGEEGGALELTYGREICRVTVTPAGPRQLNLRYAASANTDSWVEGHVTLLAHLDQPARFASGAEKRLGTERLVKEGEAWMEHAGWRIHMPQEGKVVWPAPPHNPYRKGGQSEPDEGRLVVVLPFSPQNRELELRIQIL